MKKGKKNPQKKLERELWYSRHKAKHGQHELIIVLDGLKRSYNIGKIIRSAEVFSINQIHMIQTKDFDPYPAKGAIKRVKINFYDYLTESIEWLIENGYSIYVLDTNTETSFEKENFPIKTAFIIGHEEFGVNSEIMNNYKHRKIKINQFGETESLNVSIATSIAMYEYTKQVSSQVVG